MSHLPQYAVCYRCQRQEMKGPGGVLPRFWSVYQGQPACRSCYVRETEKLAASAQRKLEEEAKDRQKAAELKEFEELGERKAVLLQEDLERYLELETLTFRAKLVMARIQSGLTKEDLLRAAGRHGGWIMKMEDLEYDPRMSDIRRYAALIGACYQVEVTLFSKEEKQSESDEA